MIKAAVETYFNEHLAWAARLVRDGALAFPLQMPTDRRLVFRLMCSPTMWLWLRWQI